jgi:hydrogenase nickel incorporation protein HypA/HybF
MHELSIAMSIIELGQEEAERRGGVRIEAVHVKVGRLSGVVKEALASAYELACQNTTLEGSRLVIEDVPIVVYCPICQAQRPLASAQSFICSECNLPTSEIVQGKELEITALEILE